MRRDSIILLVPAVLFLAACQKKETIAPEPPRPVIVQKVANPLGDEVRTFSGVIQASDAATLGFEVPGRIVRMVAKSGRAYKEGEVLAQLDVSNFESDLRRAQAEALQVNEELKRVQQLFESDNASRAQFDAAIAAQKAAASAVEVAEKKVADGTLKMPYDGVIESLLLDEQSVVGTGTGVLTIQGDGAMKIRIGVPAEMVSEIFLGMSAVVHVGRLSGEGIQAEVDRIYPQAAKNGTYPITLVLEDARAEIRGGMDAEAEMTFKNPRGDTVRVETAAVVGSADADPYVWVVEGSEGEKAKVEKRPVKIGELREQGEIEIVTGLKPGELVVTRGVHRIGEGSTVVIALQE